MIKQTATEGESSPFREVPCRAWVAAWVTVCMCGRERVKETEEEGERVKGVSALACLAPAGERVHKFEFG